MKPSRNCFCPSSPSYWCWTWGGRDLKRASIFSAVTFPLPTRATTVSFSRFPQEATSMARASAIPSLIGLRFLHDPELDRGLDARGETDRHVVDAERLDGLVEHHLALVDLETLLREEIGDVSRRDRAVKLVLFAGLDLRRQRNVTQLLGDAFGRAQRLLLAHDAVLALLAEHAEVRLRRRRGELSRDQE